MLKSLATNMGLPRTLSGALVIAAAMVLAPAPAMSADEVEAQSWSWSGPFGLFDRAQLQRGFKVYQESCQACHGLELMSFRNLGEPGGPEFSEAAVSAIAESYSVEDGPDERGDMFERPGRESDRFPPPYANEQAARAANMGAYPPDLSVMAKARGGGVDYLYALLTSYQDPPEDFELQPGMHYNPAFSGDQIAMAQPFTDGQIAYDDGTPETLENYARDVSAFLMWTAEPKMEARKRLGFQVMLFLFVFGGLMYASKRKLWRDVDH